jgi:hypothetical protein
VVNRLSRRGISLAASVALALGVCGGVHAEPVLYVSDGGDGVTLHPVTVSVMERDGDILSTWNGPAYPFDYNKSWSGTLAFDGARLYMNVVGLVYHLALDGTEISRFATGTWDSVNPTPRGLAWADNELWCASDAGPLYRIDTTNGTLLERIVLPFSMSRGLAWDGSAFWVSNPPPPTTPSTGSPRTHRSWPASRIPAPG